MDHEQYLQFAAMAFDWVFELNAVGVVLSARSFGGEEAGAYLGLPAEHFLPTAFRERFAQKFAKQKERGAARFNFVYTDEAHGRFEMLVETTQEEGPCRYRAAVRNIDRFYEGKPETLGEYQLDILEAMDEYVGIMDVHGNAVYNNEGARRLLGYESDGPRYFALDAVHPKEVIDRLMAEHLPALQREGTLRFESILLHKDGYAIPVDQIIFELKNESGAIIGFGTIAKDLRQAQATQKELEQRLSQQELVAAISMNFASADDFDLLINQALKMLTEHIGVDRTYLFRDWPELSAFSCTHEWCAEGRLPMIDASQRVPYGGDPAAYGALLARPYVATTSQPCRPDNTRARELWVSRRSSTCPSL